jgi:4-oxalocrotonate tautomerase
MPTIFFYGPELNVEKKRDMVQAFTDKASEVTGIPKSAFVVYLNPVAKDNVGIGGTLASEK